MVSVTERPLAFFGLIALPLLALPVGWLLPAHGVGLAVRLAAAAAPALLFLVAPSAFPSSMIAQITIIKKNLAS